MSETIPATRFSCRPVLELYREQYIVRGLAQAFEVPHARVEEILRDIVSRDRSELAPGGPEQPEQASAPQDLPPADSPSRAAA